jgi:hypothetical protein
MFAVRSATLLLALSVLTSPSRVSASSVVSSGADAVSVSRAVPSSIGDPGAASLNEAAGLSPMPFRRARLKAVVLEETDHDPDEADLGPINVPRMLSSHRPIASSSPFFPKTCRLRC